VPFSSYDIEQEEIVTMTLLKHPYSGLYWDDKLIKRYAALEGDGTTLEEAVQHLVERRGFELVRPEDFEPDHTTLLPSLVELGTDIVEGVARIADNMGHPSLTARETPYYTKEEAAAYLRTTVDGIYGRVERHQLERCPGSREYLFTKEMLDDSAMGRVEKPIRRRRGR